MRKRPPAANALRMHKTISRLQDHVVFFCCMSQQQNEKITNLYALPARLNFRLGRNPLQAGFDWARLERAQPRLNGLRL
jgi:hypothetical protein